MNLTELNSKITDLLKEAKDIRAFVLISDKDETKVQGIGCKGCIAEYIAIRYIEGSLPHNSELEELKTKES